MRVRVLPREDMLIEVVRQGTTLVKHLLALLLHIAVVLLDVVDESVD